MPSLTERFLEKQIYKAHIQTEQIEVMITNLLALKHPMENEFTIPFDDIVVTLETALALLQECNRITLSPT